MIKDNFRSKMSDTMGLIDKMTPAGKLQNKILHHLKELNAFIANLRKSGRTPKDLPRQDALQLMDFLSILQEVLIRISQPEIEAIETTEEWSQLVESVESVEMSIPSVISSINAHLSHQK